MRASIVSFGLILVRIAEIVLLAFLTIMFLPVLVLIFADVMIALGGGRTSSPVLLQDTLWGFAIAIALGIVWLSLLALKRFSRGRLQRGVVGAGLVFATILFVIQAWSSGKVAGNAVPVFLLLAGAGIALHHIVKLFGFFSGSRWRLKKIP
jgi:hypothetical protein